MSSYGILIQIKKKNIKKNQKKMLSKFVILSLLSFAFAEIIIRSDAENEVGACFLGT